MTSIRAVSQWKNASDYLRDQSRPKQVNNKQHLCLDPPTIMHAQVVIKTCELSSPKKNEPTCKDKNQLLWSVARILQQLYNHAKHMPSGNSE